MLDKIQTFSAVDLLALVLAGLFGLLWHYVAKLVELRKVDHGVTFKSYFLTHGIETAAAVMTMLAGIALLIQLDEASIISVTLMAFTIDSHANKFRSRGMGMF